MSVPGSPVENLKSMSKSRTIRNLSADFIISVGTQVVLTTSKTAVSESAPDSDGNIKKPGSVGVVMRSPPGNDRPYLVQFADSSTADVLFDEMVLRRQEIDSQLVDEETDYRDHIIYSCQVGSRAFGLANSDSDDDYRGIFLPPAEKHWSLFKIPEQIETNENGNDEVYWEIEKFLKLALKANPNILETLWTPMVILETPISKRLREIRQIFLTRHLYKTYSGYVLSQFRRMRNRFEKTGTFKFKHAMHLIRLLHSGIGALQTGEIMIDVSDHREQLMEIRNGKYSFEDVRKVALNLDREFQSEFEKSTLPEQPDFQIANQFLIDARRSASES